MTKFKSLASTIVVPSNFVVHLINGAQFLNAAGLALLCAVVMTSHLTKMLKCKHSCNYKD